MIFFFGWAGQHPLQVCKKVGTYFLLNEILVVAPDSQFSLCLLYVGPLLEELFVGGEDLLAQDFALLDEEHELPGLFQFSSQPSQFVGALHVLVPGLPDLPDLSSTETHVRVGVVCILPCLGLNCQLRPEQYVLLTFRIG